MANPKIATILRTLSSPNNAFREIYENGNYYFKHSVFILLIASFFILTLTNLRSSEEGLIPTNEIGYILDPKLQALDFGYNILLNFLYVVIIFYVCKKLRGGSYFKKMFSVVSCSFIPSIIGGAIAHIFLFFPSLVIAEGVSSKSAGSVYLLLIYFGIFLPFSVWSLILSIKAIKIANNFGTAKAFGILILANIITILVLLPLEIYLNLTGNSFLKF